MSSTKKWINILSGIVAWSSRPPKRTEAHLLQEMMGENTDRKSWCSLCQPELCGLSSYLKELKNKLKSRNTKSRTYGFSSYVGHLS